MQPVILLYNGLWHWFTTLIQFFENRKPSISYIRNHQSMDWFSRENLHRKPSGFFNFPIFHRGLPSGKLT